MTRRLWPTAAWLALILVCLPAALAGQPAEYAALVDAYALGLIQAPVTAFAAWQESRVRAAVAAAHLTAEQARAAVMLHTETAYTVRDDRLADLHVETARRLLGAVAGDQKREFGARWHDLIVVLYALRGDFRRARQEVAVALRADADNNEVRLVDGALYEMTARQGEPNLRGRWNSDGFRGRAELQLKAATAAYSRIVADHPTFLEARLRLGWALFLDHSPDHAREQLDEVAAQASRADLQYLTHLFIGALDERDNHLEDARRQYETAHAILPRQSSFIALIRMNRALGRDDRAQALAAELAARPSAAADDPWRSYNEGVTGGELVEWMRAKARAQ